jgi:hypothetical protein
MKKLMRVLFAVFAVCCGSASIAEASMSSELFLLENNEGEVRTISTGVWVEDVMQSEEIALRIKYPLVEAVKTELNKDLEQPVWQEAPPSKHSDMNFLSAIRRSAVLSIIMEGCGNEKKCAKDKMELSLSRHTGERAVKFAEAHEKAEELLSMSDEDLRKWIQTTAHKIVELWSKPEDPEKNSK